MSITFKHMNTQGIAHSLLACSSSCAPKHSVLFSGCCCSPAYDKIPRGILMSKATASSKCPPAGHLPKLSFGFLLPGTLPPQQLQGPGKAACCKARTSSCTTTAIRGPELGEAPWAEKPGSKKTPRRGLCQTCKTLPRVLGLEWTRQGSPYGGHGKARLCTETGHRSAVRDNVSLYKAAGPVRGSSKPQLSWPEHGANNRKIVGSLPARATQRAGPHDPCGPPSNREHAVTLGIRNKVEVADSFHFYASLPGRRWNVSCQGERRASTAPSAPPPPTTLALLCCSRSPKAAEARPWLPVPATLRSPELPTPPGPLPSQPYRLHGGARVLPGGGSAPRGRSAATAAPGGGGRTRPRRVSTAPAPPTGSEQARARPRNERKHRPQLLSVLFTQELVLVVLKEGLILLFTVIYRFIVEK